VQIHAYIDMVGTFEIASVQANFNDLPYAEARQSVELFSHQVMPFFADS
jgi:hypothetical protein